MDCLAVGIQEIQRDASESRGLEEGRAILLNRHFFGRGLVRTLIITPFLIMPVVAGLIWKNQVFSSEFGVFNWVLERFGVTIDGSGM